jgi:hypothetical protein
MRTERPEDKANEKAVIIRIERWLQDTWPGEDIHLIHLDTPEDEHGNPQEFPDFMIYRGHLHTGYGEIKCFEKPLATYKKWGSFLIDDPKISYLNGLVERGFSTILVYRTSDGHILYARVKDLFECKGQWEEAPEHFMNQRWHREGGVRENPFKGWLLPFDLFREVP